MHKSIVVSCDTYYYMLASEPGIDDTTRFMAQFGFGAKTGIDIDGELPGILPSREWKRERFRQNSREHASGTSATRSPSASARATTRSRRCSSRMRSPIDRQRRRRLSGRTS